MKPARVRLIDIGIDDDFDVSMSFAQSMIRALGTNNGGSTPIAEVEFIRTREVSTTMSALQAPASVIHVMAHGETDPDHLGFWSHDEATNVSLTDVAERFHEEGEGIEAALVFADCCSSAQGRFVKAIRDCIETPLVYIGASRSIGWHESTTFASAFYGAYFRNRGRGVSALQRGLTAAQQAIEGYRLIVDGPCPFKALELQPSRAARSSLGG